LLELLPLFSVEEHGQHIVPKFQGSAPRRARGV
jgi:hypothetical protein